MRNVENVYEEMLYQMKKGRITAAIPVKQDGKDVLYLLIGAFMSPPQDEEESFIQAVTTIKVAHAEAARELGNGEE